MIKRPARRTSFCSFRRTEVGRTCFPPARRICLEAFVARQEARKAIAPALPTAGLTASSRYVHLNTDASGAPSGCTGTAHCDNTRCRIRACGNESQHDPLASHIFVSRRNYRNVEDTKSGKRREMTARLSFNTACELGFRGSLDEWERLMGAVARR
jgi:hypothetical protein